MEKMFLGALFLGISAFSKLKSFIIVIEIP